MDEPETFTPLKRDEARSESIGAGLAGIRCPESGVSDLDQRPGAPSQYSLLKTDSTLSAISVPCSA
jgi:hypothetical protein